MSDINKIVKLLDEGKTSSLKKIIEGHEIHSLARYIDQLSEKNKVRFFLLLPTKILSEVLLEVSFHSRELILKSLKDKYIVSMIESAESDDSADILSEVPEHKAQRILDNLPKHKKETLKGLVKYEDDTAGHLMQTELLSLPTTAKVRDALKQVKKEHTETHAFNYIYVIDNKTRVKGVVSLRDLVTSDSNKQLGKIMKKDVVKVNVNLDKEKVAEVFKKKDIFALPVVDNMGKLLGRVTVDDVLDVMEEEATEDMFKIAGVHPDENIFDPFKSSLKRRLPWLVINLGTAILAGLVVALFENTLQTLVILAAFMPIIAGMGGNAGTQTLTLIVRGLALNQINLRNFKRVFFKEMFLGFVNGFVTGLIMGVIAYLWLGNIMIGVVILSAMMINLVVAGFVATGIPLMLKAFKVDPAVASSIFITTFTDVVGFFSFLGIATLLLKWIV